MNIWHKEKIGKKSGVYVARVELQWFNIKKLLVNLLTLGRLQSFLNLLHRVEVIETISAFLFLFCSTML